MNAKLRLQLPAATLAICLSACASLPESTVSTPKIRLTNIQVVGLGFDSQTFLLSFDVRNPNPFPLPVRNVGYGLKLDGQRFASGETASNFTVPAGGDTSFAISVDLNLLQTSPQLLSVVRDGARRDVSYQLDGRLALDIPLAPAVKYQTRGTIRLNAAL